MDLRFKGWQSFFCSLVSSHRIPPGVTNILGAQEWVKKWLGNTSLHSNL